MNKARIKLVFVSIFFLNIFSISTHAGMLDEPEKILKPALSNFLEELKGCFTSYTLAAYAQSKGYDKSSRKYVEMGGVTMARAKAVGKKIGVQEKEIEEEFKKYTINLISKIGSNGEDVVSLYEEKIKSCNRIYEKYSDRMEYWIDLEKIR